MNCPICGEYVVDGMQSIMLSDDPFTLAHAKCAGEPFCIRDHKIACDVTLESHVGCGNYCETCTHGDAADPGMMFVPYVGFVTKEPPYNPGTMEEWPF